MCPQKITRPIDGGQTNINPSASSPGAAKNTIWAKMWNFEHQKIHRFQFYSHEDSNIQETK